MAARTDTSSSLGVVVVVSTRAAEARGTLTRLAAQSVADRLDVVIVAADESALGDLLGDPGPAFRSVQSVLVGPIEDVEWATWKGVERIDAEYVALLEDHAFPSEDWAERTLAAHAGGYDVVGTPMRNANPHGALSWGNMLLAYGPWLEPARSGEVSSLQGHNVSFSADALRAFGDRLPAMLRRDGGLMDRLKERESRFMLTREGHIAHVNPSALRATVRLRIDAGRLYGAQRSTIEKWSPSKRAIYVMAAPLIPIVRLQRLYAEHFSGGRRGAERGRALAGLVVCLVLDAFGQMLGYAAGPGLAGDRLATFEVGRIRHLTRRDRNRLYASSAL